MIDACLNAQVPLFVAYYRRRLPLFLEVKDLLDAGAVGDPRTVSVTLLKPPPELGDDPNDVPWRVRPEIAGAGLFFDVGSHMLDILDFLLGPIASVNGEATNQGGLYVAEDAVSAAFRFHSDVIGTGLWCFTLAPQRSVDRIEITGTQGRLAFPVYEEPVLTIEDADGLREKTFENPPHVQQPLIQSVMDQLSGRGACPSTGESAARTSWVMDQVVKSWRAQAKR
jgi:predicted dehydrogenase